MGNLGSLERIEFTAIQSTVNPASRLHAHLATDEILVSNKTYKLLRDHIKCGEKTSVTVQEIDDLIGVY